jgi:hypothetical protein
VEGDHPLNSNQTSVWHQFFQDTELWEQIDRDVKRTHPDLRFFNNSDGGENENQVRENGFLLRNSLGE